MIVTALLALAAYLWHEAPVHPRLTFNKQDSIPARPVAGLERGNGPNLAARDLVGSEWWTEGATLAPQAAAAPEAAKTAYHMKETTDNGFHRVETKVEGISSGKPNVVSLFVRAGERGAIRFEMRDNHPPGKYGLATFDLLHKAVVSVSGDVSDAGMQQLPNGWFRCWAAMPYANDVAIFNFALVNKHNETKYVGDGRSGLLIWGVQFEPGENGPRGYAPGP